MTKRNAMVAVSALLLAGCATTFTGSSKVDNGPAGCKASCEAWGMDLAGMVKMGEYSDGCICQARPGATYAPAAPQPAKPAEPVAPPAPRNPARSEAELGPGGPQAVAGVWIQMQAAAAAAMQEAERRREMELGGSSAYHPYVPGSPIGSPGWRPGLH